MIEPLSSARTRYEDWRQRCERLQQWAAPPDYFRVPQQLQILQALLQRHADTPEGARAARFAAAPQLLRSRRAILVEHHLASASIGSIRNEADSRRRVGSILQRLKRLDLQQSASEPGDALGTVAPKDPAATMRSVEAAQSPATLARWVSIGNAVRHSTSPWEAYRLLEQALKTELKLPACALEFLVRRATGNTLDACLAAEFLLNARDPEALDYTLEAWTTRVAASGADHICARLASVLVRAECREAAAERMRAQLGSDRPHVRLEALRQLQVLGTLDDIGLLLDLLDTPPQAAEDAGERSLLIETVAKLAGVVL